MYLISFKIEAHEETKNDKEEWIPESDESDEDDYLDEDAAPIERKQRQGVSAEVYGEHNKKGDYKPRVVEKTAEQKERIKERMNQAFMFSALDKEETEIVINAMEEMKFK